MDFVFRVDSSEEIGTGHVMRCLRLAEELRALGKNCHFVSRDLPGNLIGRIRELGFEVSVLPSPTNSSFKKEKFPHARWLSVSQNEDAAQFLSVLKEKQIAPSWTIVDHYGINCIWQHAVEGTGKNILVIDDLADRKHACSALLDQNYFRNLDQRYSGLVAPDAKMMLGPRYAILDKRFRVYRDRSKEAGPLKFLIYFGGMDHTGQTLRILELISAQKDLRAYEYHVILGKHASSYKVVEANIAALPKAHLYQFVEDMPGLMASVDISIGAGGTTTWERACLGLPSIVISIAENQIPVSQDLGIEGYHAYLGHYDSVNDDKIVDQIRELSENNVEFERLCQKSRELCDGMGLDRVVNFLVGN